MQLGMPVRCVGQRSKVLARSSRYATILKQRTNVSAHPRHECKLAASCFVVLFSSEGCPDSSLISSSDWNPALWLVPTKQDFCHFCVCEALFEFVVCVSAYVGDKSIVNKPAREKVTTQQSITCSRTSKNDVCQSASHNASLCRFRNVGAAPPSEALVLLQLSLSGGEARMWQRFGRGWRDG